jgi:hypothetical protein
VQARREVGPDEAGGAGDEVSQECRPFDGRIRGRPVTKKGADRLE